MKNYKPPKSPSFKIAKLPAYKTPKPPKAMLPPKLTKLGQFRQPPAANKPTAQVYKRIYDRAYNHSGLRDVFK
jgi:hypothetical protein